jgi:hypothetical protein
MRRLTAALVGVLTIAILVSPPISDAQDLTPVPVPTAPPREHVGVGVATTGVVGALPWGIVSARISIPIGIRFGLDVDAGRVVGTKRLTEGQVPAGGAGGFHLRWLHKGRRPSGTSAYFFGGPRVVAAKNIDRQGHVMDRRAIRVFDLGYGLDRLMKNGWRAGVEFGAGGGEGPLLFISAFAMWGPK